MDINTKAYLPNTSQNTQTKVAGGHSNQINTHFTEKISKDDALELRAQITENANEMMLKSTTIQVGLKSTSDTDTYKGFQNFLKDIGYEGKPLAELSQSEASELISEDGIFGVQQTSERIANFVIAGAGGDEDRFRAGREGMIQGFKDAEAMWGGELLEISQKTMQAAIEMVDIAMHEAGFSVLNQEV